MEFPFRHFNKPYIKGVIGQCTSGKDKVKFGKTLHLKCYKIKDNFQIIRQSLVRQMFIKKRKQLIRILSKEHFFPLPIDPHKLSYTNGVVKLLFWKMYSIVLEPFTETYITSYYSGIIDSILKFHIENIASPEKMGFFLLLVQYLRKKA